MADVGDFEYGPCECPSGDTRPHKGILAPTAVDVGDFEYDVCEVCPSVVIESPPASPPTIQPTDAIVWKAEDTGFISALTATITDAGGNVYVAWDITKTPSFIAPYYGSAVTLSDGFEITMFKDGGWPIGTMSIEVDLTDSGGHFATASRSWNVGPCLAIAGAPDLITQARARVIIQYRESAKLLTFIDCLISPLQEIANNATRIAQLDDPTIATGVNLDVLGEIVGEARSLLNGDALTDAQYQILIAATESRNAVLATPEGIVGVLSALLGTSIQITDFGGMAIGIAIGRAPSADELAILNTDVLARPMGVTMSRVWVPPGYFGFAEDPLALGFADDSAGEPGTGGGTFAVDF